jgi:hypothetical protein
VAPRNFIQVSQGVETLGERIRRQRADALKVELSEPIRRRIVAAPDLADDARSYAELEAALDASLFEEMGTDAQTDAMAELMTQAHLIGRTAAWPTDDAAEAELET